MKISIIFQNKMNNRLKKTAKNASHQPAALFRWWNHSPIGRWVGRACILLFWILIWAFGAEQLHKPLLLPSPISVVRRLSEMVITAAFWKAAGLSFLRVLGGIVTGVGIGTLVAIVTAKIPFVKTLLKPLITTVKSTPIASFIILVNLWLDHDILPVFIAFLMVFPVIWANVDEGIQAVDPSHLALAKIYAFPRMRKIRRIYLPTVKPYFTSACHSSLGLAWKAGIAAEVLVPSVISIGKHLYESKLYLETTDLFAWTLVVVLFSLFLETAAGFVLTHVFEKKRRRKEKK